MRSHITLVWPKFKQ